MRKYGALLWLIVAPLFAQTSGPSINYILNDPTGNACRKGAPIAVRISTGYVYSCQHITGNNGTWDLVGPGASGGGGTVTEIGVSVPATSIFGVTGTPVTTSGTIGITTTGTSGGIPYFSSTSQLASSAALTANRIVLGGGAGVAPSVLGSLGTTTTVLHGNAAGAPTFGAVSLTADVSGTLPVANGGLGIASGTSGGILGFTASGTIVSSGALTANALLLGGGAGATPSALGSLGTTVQVLHGNAAGAPTFGAVSLTADVSGILPVANGGSGTSTAFTLGSVIFATTSGVFSQDNATFFWDGPNKRLGLGTATPTGTLHVSETGTATTRGITSAQYSTDTAGAQLLTRKGRGTQASPTVVVTGDTLGHWMASGYDGASYLQMASIRVEASGTVASTRVPTQIVFSTATNAAPSVLTDRWIINNAGALLCNTDGGCPIGASAANRPSTINTTSTITGGSSIIATTALEVANTGVIRFTGRGRIKSAADKQMEFVNAAETANSDLTFGGFVAYQNTGTTGVTLGSIREGAGQSTSTVFQVVANDGTTKRIDVTNSVFTSTVPFAALSTITATGVIRGNGGYQSSDGTAGVTGTCAGFPQVKNGLVVACTGI